MRKILFIMMGLMLFNLVSVSALSVTVHVPEKYHDVNAGDRFYFELAIKYPENPTRVDLRLEYEIIAPNGEVVATAKALKAVETQASFIDFIVLPEQMEMGVHKIDVHIRDYGDLSQKAGSSFQVSKNRVDTLYTLIYALIGAVAFLAVLIVVVLFRGRI